MKLSDISAYCYTDIIMTVLRSLKSECDKYVGCDSKCPFYDKECATCLLKYPCDYEFENIEKAVYKIITDEMERSENK